VRRLEAFLYSRRNIVGTLLALGGVALHFVGILGGGLGWIPITLGLYLIGYLLTPGERDLSIQLGAAQDAAEVREGLEKLLRAIKGKVADDLYAKTVSIQASILGTLEAEGASNESDPNVYLIRQTALSYLPEAFQTYLKMPRQMAERRPIADGRTPHDVFLEQLDLMDHRLADVADDIARHDSDKLLANGRFLADKFGTSALEIDGTVAASTAPPAASETTATTAPVAEHEHEKAAEEAAAAERERVH
jgi:hypothetical protein